jgi:hypothetical protein
MDKAKAPFLFFYAQPKKKKYLANCAKHTKAKVII